MFYKCLDKKGRADKKDRLNAQIMANDTSTEIKTVTPTQKAEK